MDSYTIPREILADFSFIKFIEKNNYNTICLSKPLNTQRTINYRYSNPLVIIKIVHFKDSDAERRLSIRHVNIIKYLDMVNFSDFFAIVMEYAELGSLSNCFHLSVDIKIALFYQICNGVQALHCNNIIHRDLKPSNIFLTKKNGTTIAKIGDFGVSKFVTNQGDLTKTFIGTPYYLAPEIFKGLAYNFSCDIWSLGCVVYELFTGEILFKGVNNDSLKDLVFQRIEYTNLIPKFICKILKKMLQIISSERASLFEVMQEIVFLNIIKIEFDFRIVVKAFVDDVQKLYDKHYIIFLLNYLLSHSLQKQSKDLKFYDIK